MGAFLPIGHRHKGAGIGIESMPDLERGIILQRHKGRTVYVDSAQTGTAGTGETWGSAYTTIAAAVAASVPDDMIFVAPGHTETVSTAAGISFTKANVQVIGLGRGTRRPTITMSAVASTIAIGAASATLANVLILSTAACTIVIDINSTDATIDSVEFRRGSGTVPVVWIDINGGSANACDRARVANCVLNTGTNVGATGFIELGEVADQVIIEDCIVWGDFGDACIHNPTGKVLTNLLIQFCTLSNLQTGDHSIELVSACTGMLSYCNYGNDMTQATGCDPGSCRSFQCFHDDTIDVSAILCPAGT